MAIYDVNGNLISASADAVYIAAIKADHPSYTDDELLAAAITAAKSIGPTATIIWDGTDIHFSGQVTHVCKGFGGIDFNNSKVYMPNYDGGTIIQIEPDSSSEVTVSYSAISGVRTTSNDLKNKVFRMNSNIDGNASMCLGYRMPKASYDNKVMYYSPTVKTTPDGYFTTGELFFAPSSGNITCYNVHDFPAVTFEICNARVITYASSNMSLFILCTRSNTHIHHIDCSGRSTVNTYHSGIFSVDACSDVEVDHIYGVNPVQKSLTSGYVFSLNQVSFAYVHDISIGDSTGWGAIGCGNLTNTVWERCYTDRWDCHYIQCGYNIVRDCTINHCQYGIGNGSLVFENCTILLNSSVKGFIELREDVVGVFDGDIIIRNCDFLPGAQSASNLILLQDGCSYAKQSNSAVSGAPKKRRFVSKCRVPDGLKYVFQTGSATTADQPMFANLVYGIEDTIIGSGTTELHPLGSQTAASVSVSDSYWGIGS